MGVERTTESAPVRNAPRIIRSPHLPRVWSFKRCHPERSQRYSNFSKLPPQPPEDNNKDWNPGNNPDSPT